MIPLDQLKEALAEVNAEVGVRQRVYPKWVKEGRLSQVEADKKLGRMRTAAERLRLDVQLVEIGNELVNEKTTD